MSLTHSQLKLRPILAGVSSRPGPSQHELPLRMDLDFTFLACTYNRSNHLADLLESGLTQDAASITYEIVVVDNNSTDDTAQTVERFQQSSGDRLRYFFEGRQGKSLMP